MQPEEKKSVHTGAVWRVYAQAAFQYPYRLALIIAGGLILQAATLAAPWFLRQFFNLLAAHQGDPAILNQLLWLLVLVALMWFLQWVGRRLQDMTHMYFQARIMAQLLDKAFGYVIGHSHNFFISTFAGSLTHKVSKFGRAFEIITDSILLQFLPTLTFVTGAVVVLFFRHPLLGISLAVWTILFLWFQLFLAKLRQPVRVALAEADTKMTGTLADALSNQATITLFSGGLFERSLFGKVVNDWYQKTVRLWLIDNLIWSAVGLFILAIEVGLMYGALLLWQQNLLTIGDFVLIQAYLLTTFERLVAINRELRRFYSSLADAAEMVEILETPHEIKDQSEAKPLIVTNGVIEFKNLTFAFNNRPVLDSFNLTIAPHEKIALVGPSGAGKSTITKLLLRLYDVKDGSIEIDGQNIAAVTQESLRNAIAFVPQEPILFHRTLMENIRYGRRDATDEEVIEAARKAHCHEFISSLPEKYGTYVGERGIKLSGGERQRVAIARAILKDAPILLLDEATSSLDSESEALIQDALATLMQGKTVMVIAHRLSTIMRMDRIVVLQEGKLVAQGTHQELLAQDGLYQKLWSIQAGGFIGFVDEV